MKAPSLFLMLGLGLHANGGAAVISAMPAGALAHYQALLFQGEATGPPAGLVNLTVQASGKATGTVTTDDSMVRRFATVFQHTVATADPSSTGFSASLVPISLPRGRGVPALDLALNIVLTADEPILTAVLRGEGLIDRVANSGFRVITPPRGGAEWAGRYEMGFATMDTAAEVEEAWSGYATGTVSPNGVLSMAGVMADGVPFTASLPAGACRNYVAFLNPYKKRSHFLAGAFALARDESGTGFTAAKAGEGSVDFLWQKNGFAAKKDDRPFLELNLRMQRTWRVGHGYFNGVLGVAGGQHWINALRFRLRKPAQKIPFGPILVVVPEPSRTLLLFGSLAAVMFRRRRPRQLAGCISRGG